MIVAAAVAAAVAVVAVVVAVVAVVVVVIVAGAVVAVVAAVLSVAVAVIAAIGIANAAIFKSPLSQSLIISGANSSFHCAAVNRQIVMASFHKKKQADCQYILLAM